MDTVKRNFAILFVILFVVGTVCIFRGQDLGIFVTRNIMTGLTISSELGRGAAWIVFGGILSFLSGYGLVRMALKYME